MDTASQTSNNSSTNPVPASSRFPVWHPEFRYSESRNIYFKKLQEMRGRVYSDHETESLCGRWREAFPDRLKSNPATELHVEIGCNAGHVILEWSRQNPNRAYVGIDWKYKPIFWGAEKAVRANLDNLLFFRAHAERVGYMFGDSEIDRLSIFFPDPWPRKKQHKNRWVTAARLRELHRVIKPTGILHIKTDHPGYFEWMEQAVEETRSLWETVERTNNRHANHPAPRQLDIPEVTLFEKLFIRDGIPIHSLQLRPIK